MIRDTIKAAQISAMKAGEKDKLAAVRLILAKIKDRDIELRTASQTPDDDAIVVEVLQKMVKQRRESIALYEQGGRARTGRCRKRRTRRDRDLPARANERGRNQRRDRSDQGRTGRVHNKGYGPRHGRTQSPPRRQPRHEQGKRAGEGGVELNKPFEPYLKSLQPVTVRVERSRDTPKASTTTLIAQLKP